MCPPLERQGGENQNHQELIKPGVEPELPVQGYIRSTYFQIIYSNYLLDPQQRDCEPDPLHAAI